MGRFSPRVDGARGRGAIVTLTSEIEAVIAGLPGTFGIYARNLQSGEIVAIDAERVMPAESTAKTGILVFYEQLVASGAIEPTTRVELTAEHKYIGTGVLRFLADGLAPTLDDLAWLMIIVSDNTATAMMMQTLGGITDLNAAMRALGCPTVQLNEITFEDALGGAPFSLASPCDLAELYTHLDARSREILYRQQHLIGLPRRVPHMAMAADVDIEMPVRVFNKTGNGAGRFVDSGLFETDAAAWVVAAMADEQTDFASRPDDAAPSAFGAIGELLYDAWGGASAE
jgi:beta-lactamase class A